MVFTSDRDGRDHLRIMPATGGAAEQLTSGPVADMHPCWSPDGTTIAFMSERTGNRDLWIVPSTGGIPIQITDHPDGDLYPCWSPDGSRIAFASERTGNSEIWIVELPPLAPAPRRAAGRVGGE